MKISLVVLTPGKMQGKAVAVPGSEFLIGRDPQCHLRPASALISHRHCALRVRGSKAYVQDFGSTNGTLVNDEPVEGERELHHGDVLKVGPVAFRVHIESSVPVNKPTPLPPTKVPAAAGEEDEAAALLLAMQGDDAPAAGSPGLDPSGVPLGETRLDEPGPAGSAEAGTAKPGEGAPDAKQAKGDTSAAAKDILEKYRRRSRT
jgi:predicted component of type VI protein secretion system